MQKSFANEDVGGGKRKSSSLKIQEGGLNILCERKERVLSATLDQPEILCTIRSLTYELSGVIERLCDPELNLSDAIKRAGRV